MWSDQGLIQVVKMALSDLDLSIPWRDQCLISWGLKIEIYPLVFHKP